MGPTAIMSLLFFVLSLFIFDFSFFIHMEIIKKKKKKSPFIPFPLQTLTSEESTLEFYDIYDTSFLKELLDFSDELFICHKPYMFINTYYRFYDAYDTVFCQSPS